MMGVVSVNLSLQVETWYRGCPSGQRSEIINRALTDHIRVQLGDIYAMKVGQVEKMQLLQHAVQEFLMDEEDCFKVPLERLDEIIRAKNRLCALLEELEVR